MNDVPQQGFHSTEECNIGNNIKIRISIDSKIPVEISHEQQQQQHEYMASNSFCKPWQNERALTNCYMIETSHPQMIKEYEEQLR